MKKLHEMLSLKGRVALVTGGTGHLGSIITDTLIEMGCYVAITDVSHKSGQEIIDKYKKMGYDTIAYYQADLSRERDTRRLYQSIINDHSGLDIFIHCAGYVGTTEIPGWSVPFEDQSLEAWEASMRVNLSSAFVFVQEAKNALARSGRGSIVFISSIYGFLGPDLGLYENTGMGNPLAYGVSKAGLIQMARYLATVLAPSIRVNVISPGGIWRNQPEQFVKKYISRTPLSRMASEEDIKGAVAYLASDLSLYMTGQNLILDGGWSVW